MLSEKNVAAVFHDSHTVHHTPYSKCRFYISLDTKRGHFKHVLPSKWLSIILKKLNITDMHQ